MARILLLTLSSRTHRTCEENLGVQYLSSALKNNNFDVIVLNSWIDNLSINDIFSYIKENSFLFVGISTSYMININDCKELIRLIKSHDKNIRVVCGGFGPTFSSSEYINFGADIVCIGEGEETIVDIANYYEHKDTQISKVKGIVFAKNTESMCTEKRELIKNLDTIPFPTRDTLDFLEKLKSPVSISTSRGCTGKCDFCSVASFFSLSKGKRWRGRSVNNIVDELELLNKNGVFYIKVVDDSFIDGNRNEAWCEEFRDEIIKRRIKLKMKGQIRADKISEESMRYLKEAGFYSFSCGVENGSETALRRMNKSSNIDQIEDALTVMRKYNYIFQMNYILFDNKTTYQELKENYTFFKRHLWTVTKGVFTEKYPLEGTLYTQILSESGELDDGFSVNRSLSFTHTYDDVRVSSAYTALKRWHTAHTYIYDMTIDPIVAPRAIDNTSIFDLYSEMMIVKEIDINFFEKVLSLTDMRISIKEIENFTMQEIANQKSAFENVFSNVSEIYKRNDIVYDAIENPFFAKVDKNPKTEIQA